MDIEIYRPTSFYLLLSCFLFIHEKAYNERKKKKQEKETREKQKRKRDKYINLYVRRKKKKKSTFNQVGERKKYTQGKATKKIRKKNLQH